MRVILNAISKIWNLFSTTFRITYIAILILLIISAILPDNIIKIVNFYIGLIGV